MNQSTGRPKAIKFLREDESPEIIGRRIDSDSEQANRLPEGCYLLNMVVLEKPEPIRKAPKKQK